MDSHTEAQPLLSDSAIDVATYRVDCKNSREFTSGARFARHFYEAQRERENAQPRPLLTISVTGLPVPQGSKSARVVHGRAIMTDGFGDKPRRLKDWRRAIAAAVAVKMETNGYRQPLDGPIMLLLTFYLPRPKSTPRKVLYPATRPDADKLCRAALDAMTKIVYVDDSRIVDLTVRKEFATDRLPGVTIDLFTL